MIRERVIGEFVRMVENGFFNRLNLSLKEFIIL